MEFKSAKFVISNTDYRKCPAANKPEYAFIGRSNVGKSSLINMLTNHKNLAKTSGKPGKTQLINHFIVDDSWYLVDLPGYGWAQVSKTQKQQWQKMIRAYLTHRSNLCLVFVLVCYSFFENLEILMYLCWPAFMLIGMAFTPEKMEEYNA